MEREEIIARVNQTLISDFEIGPEKLNATAHLFEDLELDSLDAVDMLVHLEDNFHIKLDMEKFSEIRKLDDVYNLIQSMSQS